MLTCINNVASYDQLYPLLGERAEHLKHAKTPIFDKLLYFNFLPCSKDEI